MEDDNSILPPPKRMPWESLKYPGRADIALPNCYGALCH
jgi:hypothetical protein